MKKSLPFNIPFAGYDGATFINCLASTYMFLENITGDDNYECKKQNGQPCDGCGNCHNKTSTLQERIFFLFDTMSGHSSLRNSFDGELTEMQKMICEDDNIDNNVIKFLFDFTAYEYQKLNNSSEFKTAIIESINQERPVLAKVKSGLNRFRVITGYDDDIIICPDYTGAQNKPEGAPTYDELDTIYIIGKGIKPRYSLLEKGLKRIEKVMEYNLKAYLWDEYIEKFRYWGGGLEAQDLEEIKRRFNHIAETMWYTFNCHNFAETFRHCVYEEMRDPAFTDCWSRIDVAYNDMHTRAWSIIHLETIINWQNRPKWGICEIIPLIIEKMKQNDIEVLDAVKRALKILHLKRDTKPILIYDR